MDFVVQRSRDGVVVGESWILGLALWLVLQKEFSDNDFVIKGRNGFQNYIFCRRCCRYT